MSNNEDRVKDLFQRLGISLYQLIFVLAITLGISHLLIELLLDRLDFLDSVSSTVLSLATELLAITIVFWLVNKRWDPDEERRRKLDATVERLAVDVERMEQALLEHESRLVAIPTSTAIYGRAIDTLQGERWSKVRVFAPVGVWHNDSDKAEWLEALADAAYKGAVEEVRGVFGLPSISTRGDRKPTDSLSREIQQTHDLLELFDNLKNVHLRYHPPYYASVAIGTIIFQRKDFSGQIAIGLATHSHEDVVDTALAVNDAQIFSYSVDWFDSRIWESCSEYVIQDQYYSFSDTWDGIVSKWYV